MLVYSTRKIRKKETMEDTKKKLEESERPHKRETQDPWFRKGIKWGRGESGNLFRAGKRALQATIAPKRPDPEK